MLRYVAQNDGPGHRNHLWPATVFGVPRLRKWLYAAENQGGDDGKKRCTLGIGNTFGRQQRSLAVMMKQASRRVHRDLYMTTFFLFFGFFFFFFTDGRRVAFMVN